MEMQRNYDQLLKVSFDGAMPYEWAIGKYGSRFFQELKERGKFLGIRCPQCGKVYIPPRRVCGPCFREIDELVELPDSGTIMAFTVVNYPFIDPDTGKQRPIPYTYGLIRIDGADCFFSHLVNETDVGRIKVGKRVRAVLKSRDEMQGNIEDIRYFEIID